MNDRAAQIAHLHAVFCAATGLQIRMGICEYFREHSWLEFIKAGFTEQDILAWAAYLHRKIREGTRNPGALKFSNSIGRLDVFDEDLGMAKAEARVKKPTARDKALNALRPTAVALKPEDGRVTARPVGDLIADLKRAAGMRTTV